MENTKLIAIDLGGTLLSDNNSISEDNIKTLNEAKKNGIKIALITARMYSSTKYISKIIHADYGVFGNGSVVMDLKNNKALKEDYLSKEDLLNLIKFGKEEKSYIHINRLMWELSDENKYFALKHNLLNLDYPEELKTNIMVVDDLMKYCKNINDVVKIIYISEQNMDSMYEEIEQRFPQLCITEYNKGLNEHKINKIINYIEIGNGISNKALGLRELINNLNISNEEVFVIGDGVNDIEMFDQYNNSACMINGNECAKQHARYISDYSNNESGVSDIIKKYVFKK